MSKMTLRSHKNPVLIPTKSPTPSPIPREQSDTSGASENPHLGITGLDRSLTAEHSSIELLDNGLSASPENNNQNIDPAIAVDNTKRNEQPDEVSSPTRKTKAIAICAYCHLAHALEDCPRWREAIRDVSRFRLTLQNEEQTSQIPIHYQSMKYTSIHDPVSIQTNNRTSPTSQDPPIDIAKGNPIETHEKQTHLYPSDNVIQELAEEEDHALRNLETPSRFLPDKEGAKFVAPENGHIRHTLRTTVQDVNNTSDDDNISRSVKEINRPDGYSTPAKIPIRSIDDLGKLSLEETSDRAYAGLTKQERDVWETRFGTKLKPMTPLQLNTITTTAQVNSETLKGPKVEVNSNRESIDPTHRSSRREDKQNYMPDVFNLRQQTPRNHIQTKQLPNDSANYRATSQLAASGYLPNAILNSNPGGPPSPPSSSSDTSSPKSAASWETSLRKLNKKKKLARKYKKQIEYLSRVKIPEPPIYDGTRDYDLFEAWIYQINNYYELTQFPIPWRIKHIRSFLSRQAASWYMTFVALNPNLWTLQTMGLAFFNHIFPPQLRSQQRQKFLHSTQGGRTIKEWIRHVKTLAARVPDITDRHIVIQIWEGSNNIFREYWARDGLQSELCSLEDLEIAGERTEAVLREIARNNALQNGRHGQNNSSFNRNRNDFPRRPFNQTGNQRPQWYNNRPQQQQQQQHRSTPNGNWRRTGYQNSSSIHSNSTARANSNTRQPSNRNLPFNSIQARRNNGQFNRQSGRQNHNQHQNRNNRSGQGRPYNNQRQGFPSNRDNRSTLSKLEQDRLRANNQCFNCKESGHLSKDCLARNTARPPNLRNSAVKLDLNAIQKLSDTAIRVNTVILGDPNDDKLVPRSTTPALSTSSDESIPGLTTVIDSSEEDPELLPESESELRTQSNIAYMFELCKSLTFMIPRLNSEAPCTTEDKYRRFEWRPVDRNHISFTDTKLRLEHTFEKSDVHDPCFDLGQEIMNNTIRHLHKIPDTSCREFIEYLIWTSWAKLWGTLTVVTDTTDPALGSTVRESKHSLPGVLDPAYKRHIPVKIIAEMDDLCIDLENKVPIYNTESEYISLYATTGKQRFTWEPLNMYYYLLIDHLTDMIHPIFVNAEPLDKRYICSRISRRSEAYQWPPNGQNEQNIKSPLIRNPNRLSKLKIELEWRDALDKCWVNIPDSPKSVKHNTEEQKMIRISSVIAELNKEFPTLWQCDWPNRPTDWPRFICHPYKGEMICFHDALFGLKHVVAISELMEEDRCIFTAIIMHTLDNTDLMRDPGPSETLYTIKGALHHIVNRPEEPTLAVDMLSWTLRMDSPESGRHTPPTRDEYPDYPDGLRDNMNAIVDYLEQHLNNHVPPSDPRLRPACHTPISWGPLNLFYVVIIDFERDIYHPFHWSYAFESPQDILEFIAHRTTNYKRPRQWMITGGREAQSPCEASYALPPHSVTPQSPKNTSDSESIILDSPVSTPEELHDEMPNGDIENQAPPPNDYQQRLDEIYDETYHARMGMILVHLFERIPLYYATWTTVQHYIHAEQPRFTSGILSLRKIEIVDHFLSIQHVFRHHEMGRSIDSLIHEIQYRTQEYSYYATPPIQPPPVVEPPTTNGNGFGSPESIPEELGPAPAVHINGEIQPTLTSMSLQPNQLTIQEPGDLLQAPEGSLSNNTLLQTRMMLLIMYLVNSLPSFDLPTSPFNPLNSSRFTWHRIGQINGDQVVFTDRLTSISLQFEVNWAIATDVVTIGQHIHNAIQLTLDNDIQSDFEMGSPSVRDNLSISPPSHTPNRGHTRPSSPLAKVPTEQNLTLPDMTSLRTSMETLALTANPIQESNTASSHHTTDSDDSSPFINQLLGDDLVPTNTITILANYDTEEAWDRVERRYMALLDEEQFVSSASVQLPIAETNQEAPAPAKHNIDDPIEEPVKCVIKAGQLIEPVTASKSCKTCSFPSHQVSWDRQPD